MTANVPRSDVYLGLDETCWDLHLEAVSFFLIENSTERERLVWTSDICGAFFENVLQLFGDATFQDQNKNKKSTWWNISDSCKLELDSFSFFKIKTQTYIIRTHAIARIKPAGSFRIPESFLIPTAFVEFHASCSGPDRFPSGPRVSSRLSDTLRIQQLDEKRALKMNDWTNQSVNKRMDEGFINEWRKEGRKQLNEWTNEERI